MGYQDVVFLPSRSCLCILFHMDGSISQASGLPHVLELCLVVSKGMFTVEYFCFNDAYLVSVEFCGDN